MSNEANSRNLIGTIYVRIFSGCLSCLGSLQDGSVDNSWSCHYAVGKLSICDGMPGNPQVCLQVYFTGVFTKEVK